MTYFKFEFKAIIIFSSCADQEFVYSTVRDSMRGWKTDAQDTENKNKRCS